MSIGTPEKLKKYLQLNPFMKDEQFYVDGYQTQSYKDAGLGMMNLGSLSFSNIKKPKLGGAGQWLKYVSNFKNLAPIPDGESLRDIPDTVLMLGGTFVMNGDDLIYKWKDSYPGETPNIEEVLGIAASNKVYA